MYSEALMASVACRFRVLAEPLRLRLLHALRRGERTVTALVEELGARQANVSKHLAVLHQEGLVARRRDGLNSYYRIADPSVFKLCDLVCGRIEARATQQARVLRRRT